MKLQFKHQPFQAEAAAAVCDVFNGQPYRTVTYRRDLGDTAGQQLSMEDSEVGFRNQPFIPEVTNRRILDNLRAVQRRNGLRPSDELTGPGVNLSIEMETGTGKTYTYVKTMYELNKRYGWSKYIIVVPSVAIREGVYKSLQTTQEHFAEEYGRKIRFFIYSSDNLPAVDTFASDSAINVMIINMQAFNSSKNQRIIDKKLDTFRSRKPIDIIAKTNPILIIDEPQSVEGKQTKESLKKFCPLFTLRYSATHKEKYDMVYRLDAMDAYNQHLVKKIAALGVTLQGSTATTSYVYLEGIDLYKDKSPTARLGFEVKGKIGTRTVVRKVSGGDDLYDLSDGLDEYADRFKILPDGIDGRDNSVTFLNGLKLYAGQISGSEQMVVLQRRIQIRETIRTHIQREQELYRKGIKVLSLFFIDEVSKYRSYDGDDDAGRNGEYAQMFEEEYDSVVSELQRKIGDESYLRYLDKLSARTTHQGYFSIDKKKGKKARFVESKVDRKTQTSDDADAYDLIMKDKERLLSLDEPVRFIFSHSALREGWDNPNVFQICTLKKQSDSDIRSRQEIGRGLRLCVDQQGERMDESVLGSEVQELNKLTLITDMEFGKFAEALQSGLAESLADRPKKVDTQLFLGKVLTDANGSEVKVAPELATAIYEDLVSNGYVKRGELTDKYYADKASGTVQVAEEVKDCTAAVVQVLSSIYDSHSMRPEDAHGNNVEARVDPEKLHKKEFVELWNRINHKSFYTVRFDKEILLMTTGITISELCALTWGSFSFSKTYAGIIVVEIMAETKLVGDVYRIEELNGPRRRTIPLPPAVAKFYHRVRDNAPNIQENAPFMRSFKNAARRIRPDEFDRWLKGFFKSFGFSKQPELKSLTKNPERTLRATFRSALESCGCDADEIRYLYGSAPESVFARNYCAYDDPRELAKLAAVLDKYAISLTETPCDVSEFKISRKDEDVVMTSTPNCRFSGDVIIDIDGISGHNFEAGSDLLLCIKSNDNIFFTAKLKSKET